jgi:drug/metabolite transporter (DMT)-like permease
LHAQLAGLSRADWLRLALLGVVFYTLTQGAQFVALDHLPAVTLSLILSFSPAAVALAGAWLLGERLSRRQWGGVALFLIGATVYFLPQRVAFHGAGLAVGVLAMTANSGGALLGRSVNRRGDLHPLLVTVVSMGIGSLLLLATGLVVEGMPALDGSGWAIVVWLAVVNTAIAFTLWNHTLRRLTAIESSLINNTMLVQIAVLAWIFLDEPIGARQGTGLLLAVLGAVLVQLPERRRVAD